MAFVPHVTSIFLPKSCFKNSSIDFVHESCPTKNRSQTFYIVRRKNAKVGQVESFSVIMNDL